MEPNEDRWLTPTPSNELTAPQIGRNRILGEMVGSMLELAKEDLVAPFAEPKTIAAISRTDGKVTRMNSLRAQALVCEKCPHLVRSRTQVVFGVGNIDAEVLFVGEAPGVDEDLQGDPFVGKAGQLLTEIIGKMGFRRNDVYIATVLKCRPDTPQWGFGARKPTPTEMQTCLPYLRQQIDIIQPSALVVLGASAMEGLSGITRSMNILRGRWHEFGGIPLMATYHPAYLLGNQLLTEKRKVWEDMLMVLERLGHPITENQRSYFL